MKSPFYIILTLQLLGSWSHARLEWEFPSDHEEQENWNKIFKTCSTDKQSPIDIITSDTIYSSALLPIISFLGEGIELDNVTYSVFHNGHTISILFPKDTWFGTFPGMEENVLVEFYQIQFRWGADQFRGSEHLLNGRPFSLETLLLGFDRKRYDTMEDAQVAPRGLIVLGFWSYLDDTAEFNETIFGQLGNFNDTLPKVLTPESLVEIPAFNLTDLFSVVDPSRYYLYLGSQTTPPCLENVEWFIFEKLSPVTNEQLNLLKNLFDYNGKQLQDNFRREKPLNVPESIVPRTVYRSFKNLDDAGDEI